MTKRLLLLIAFLLLSATSQAQDFKGSLYNEPVKHSKVNEAFNAALARQMYSRIAGYFDSETSDLSSPTGGQVAYRSDLGTVKYYNSVASAWRTFADTTTSVPPTRTINTTSPLTGGGDLSADRTFGCATCEVTTANILPDGAGTRTVGSSALPYSQVIIGGAANQRTILQTNAVGARAATFPNKTGTVAFLDDIPAAGITNSAGANVVPKTVDGSGNLGASPIASSSAGDVTFGNVAGAAISVGGYNFTGTGQYFTFSSNSANPYITFGDESGDGGGTLFELDDTMRQITLQAPNSASGQFAIDGTAKTITATASTESQTINGTAHTISLTAATGISFTTGGGVASMPSGATGTVLLDTTTESLLATVTSVNMNTATATTLYTCPAAKTCVITKVQVTAASTSLTTASWSYGWNSASFNDVITNATHTELTGSTLYTILLPKAGATLGTATGIFKVLMNTLQGGAATTTMRVFGFTY